MELDDLTARFCGQPGYVREIALIESLIHGKRVDGEDFMRFNLL
jgi:hypothetical protein